MEEKNLTPALSNEVGEGEGRPPQSPEGGLGQHTYTCFFDDAF